MKNKTKINPPCDDKCPVRASLSLLSGKWTLMILFQINENVVRYGELKRAVAGISEKMLIQELNMLVENKLVFYCS
ncbi:MAG: transcriptional regulator [Flavobacteriales bacterium]|nr:MAG: transcriptional regulator [Flavobacteriales bacterium]